MHAAASVQPVHVLLSPPHTRNVVHVQEPSSWVAVGSSLRAAGRCIVAINCKPPSRWRPFVLQAVASVQPKPQESTPIWTTSEPWVTHRLVGPCPNRRSQSCRRQQKACKSHRSIRRRRNRSCSMKQPGKQAVTVPAPPRRRPTIQIQGPTNLTVPRAASDCNGDACRRCRSI